jgi:hypothetical protein
MLLIRLMIFHSRPIACDPPILPFYPHTHISAPSLPSPLSHFPAQYAGAAAFAGLTRTDPDAVWSFQGWAIADWNTALQVGNRGNAWRGVRGVVE